MKRCYACEGSGALLRGGVPYSCDHCNGQGHNGRPWWQWILGCIGLVLLMNVVTCTGCMVLGAIGGTEKTKRPFNHGR